MCCLFGKAGTQKVSVGILSAPVISFTLEGSFTFNGKTYSGNYSVCQDGRELIFDNKRYTEAFFVPVSDFCRFILHDVLIGKNFHWERKEDEEFAGELRLILSETQLTAINIVDVETYLLSVISSEMSGRAPLEYLKAQTVISRSWLMRILTPKKLPSGRSTTEIHDINPEGIERVIKWYENDAHKDFDVCADDHCQRYEGVTRISNPDIFQAVNETKGEVLWYEGEICDARFSKSCGGVTERFSSCWANEDKDYLLPVCDMESEGPVPDLSIEQNAEKWIHSTPKAFCNTSDQSLISQVLNDYDQETADFYRWKTTYSVEELSDIVRTKSDYDIGAIKDLIPLKRGASGRIIQLLLVGEKRKMIVGKELEIRKLLSTSHLLSSAFTVKKEYEREDKLKGFTIFGAGWGHGVGLCQIGASFMASRGYKYTEILSHYFKNSQLKKIYE